jgi:alcohol dehydrogenase (NADP+)/uncharacterized zinc-type alcohol dehydrogenase-like protein
MMQYNVKKGDKVGVIGIGGLGHMAIKIAVSKVQKYMLLPLHRQR